MPMLTPDILAILITIVGVGIALAALILRVTARLDRHIAEAGADRRAFQESMERHQREMQRLAERQSHVEGYRHGQAQAGSAPAE